MVVENDGLTEQLVDYTLGLTYESIPPEVVDRTKQFFLDFLGVALGGSLAHFGGRFTWDAQRVLGLG